MGRMKYPCVCIEFRRHHLTGEAGTMVYGESLQAFVHPCACRYVALKAIRSPHEQ